MTTSSGRRGTPTEKYKYKYKFAYLFTYYVITTVPKFRICITAVGWLYLVVPSVKLSTASGSAFSAVVPRLPDNVVILLLTT